MQSYKIKRAGREFVVYSGESQILKCATKREAQKAIRDAQEGRRNPLMTKKQSIDFGWLLGAILIAALVLLYSFHQGQAHEVRKTVSSCCR